MLDAGWIARVLGGLGQLLQVGLGVIEGNDDFVLLESHVGLRGKEKLWNGSGLLLFMAIN